MSAETAAMLAELTTIAAESGWRAVLDFQSRIADPADRTILLVGPDSSDTEALAQWLRECDDNDDIEVRALAEVADDESPTLGANRIVLAMPCAPPRGVSSAAVRMMTSRTATSFLMVVTGAEAITTSSDLEMVDRWMADALAVNVANGDSDIDQHGSLLWTSRPSATAPVLTQRLSRDRASLLNWRRAPTVEDGKLEISRVRHALGLAERDNETPVSHSCSPTTRLRSNALESARSTRERVLRDLTAASAGIVRRADASLHMLEGDFRRKVAERGTRGQVAAALTSASTETRVARIDGVLQRAADRWLATESAATRQRADEVSARLREVIRDASWAPIEHVLGPDQQRRARSTLSDAVRFAVEPFTAPAGQSTRSAMGAGQRGRVDLVPPAVGGAIGAAAAIAFGAGALPVITAGIIGATGVTAAHGALTNKRTEKTVATRTGAQISAIISRLRETIEATIADATASTRVKVAAAFDELDRSITSPRDDLAEPSQRAAGQRLERLWHQAVVASSCGTPAVNPYDNQPASGGGRPC